MDFSNAESKAYCQAFANVLRENGDNRSLENLKKIAESLVRGCTVHYHRSIHRVSRLGEVVPQAKAQSFKTSMTALLSVESPAAFHACCQDIIDEYPRTANFVNWWRRPQNAQKLFEGVRTMDPKLWDSMASTNNPEEALHARLYASLGRDHQLLGGLGRLQHFMKMLAMLHEHAKSTYLWLIFGAVNLMRAGGQTLEYSPELWKRIQDDSPILHERDRQEKRKVGKQRQLRIPNDGRAPDKASQLRRKVSAKTVLGKRVRHARQKPQPHPSSPLRSEPVSESSSHEESVASAIELEPTLEHEYETTLTSQMVLPRLQIATILASKRMAALQCLPWRANSCWFDTSLTLLAAAVYRCWPRVQGILVHGNLEHGQAQLGQMLELYLQSMQYSAQHSANRSLCEQIALQLASAREDLRAILQRHYPTGPSYLTDQHYLWVS